MFNYKVFDNFLTNSDFEEISNLNLGDISDNGKKVFHNRIYKNGNIESSCIKKELIKRMHEKYFSQALNLLEAFAPKKINLYEYSDFHFVIAGKNYKYPIHIDTHNKLLSGVIYLKPTKNFGTRLYGENKKDSIDLEWKPNRALFFSRNKNTFHSYKSNGISERITLIYNLMTTNVKEACKIDGDSYTIVRFKQYLKKILKY